MHKGEKGSSYMAGGEGSPETLKIHFFFFVPGPRPDGDIFFRATDQNIMSFHHSGSCKTSACRGRIILSPFLILSSRFLALQKT